ncbi:zinc metalloprotease [Rhizobium ruizarguesonis]|uniref:hypothetical protein n=1 Tax=Rhizobium ruizarguesonis TaxID=2081791 RepID=UPI0013D392AB|nr:hypothetical protein [Rhizobium ruizarguesonis]NEH76845.1 hypothetical protein [Rhizobium ruizarguesonis]
MRPTIVLMRLLSVLAACSAAATPTFAQDQLANAIEHPDDADAVNRYIETLPEIPPGSGHFMIEGDLYLDRPSVVAFLKSKTETKPLPAGELIVDTINGQPSYLKAIPSRQMTYSLVASSFPNDQLAQRTDSELKQAAQDWIDACANCNISLKEIPIAQAGKFYEKVTFVLTYLDVQGGPIARSFFPSSPPDDRQIVIFPDFFSKDMTFDRRGVLRHEFGHILGYRHEQLEQASGCNTAEPNNWKPLTPYNPHSVMHYMCGKGGSFSLALTGSDIKGHRCLYLTGAACPPGN